MRRALGRVAVLGAVLAAGSALAFVMPAWSILRRMVNAREELGASNVRADGAASFYGSGAREAAAALGLPADRAEVQVDAAVLFKAPGRCRFELLPVEGSRAASVLSDGKDRREGRELAILDIATEELCAVLATRSGDEAGARDGVLAYLKENRVDTSATSLARFSGQVAYVMGSPAEGKPQFWVYKDAFLPARLKLTDKGTAWDVRFLDYTSPVTGEHLPRMLEVYGAASW